MPNNVTGFSPTERWKDSEEDGCDVYIDEIRHLPDNCSLVKIVAKVINEKT